METDAAEAVAHLGPLGIHVESFLDDLEAVGYTPGAVARRRAIVIAFVQWTRAERIALQDLTEAHLAAFVKRRPQRRETRHELAALRRFLAHVRARGAVPVSRPQSVSPAEALAQGYVAFLRTDRGLAENSILVYAPCARDFLSDRVATRGELALDALDAEAVRAFLLTRIAHRSSEWSRLLTVALRSFLRFLFLRGEAPRDLSAAVPTIRTYRQAAVPAVLSPEDVERVLAAPDRSTTRGRRDHAILLLLARLGLRASEVVSLELGDLRWRTGEIVVRGKGPRRDQVPLLADVGDAVARYLREDRGPSVSRRVFLRLIPPRVGLARPCAIDHVVRLALARAGVCPPRGRVAHLFRHSLATRMIRHGASLAEIAEVLRHRSQTTTAIYAKVSFDALRSVARPWPVPGGVR
jgi:site-specific recombinase XerD